MITGSDRVWNSFILEISGNTSSGDGASASSNSLNYIAERRIFEDDETISWYGQLKVRTSREFLVDVEQDWRSDGFNLLLQSSQLFRALVHALSEAEYWTVLKGFLIIEDGSVGLDITSNNHTYSSFKVSSGFRSNLVNQVLLIVVDEVRDICLSSLSM